MKKEPLFFTEKTEIGAQHVPIDSKKFAEGGLIAPNGKPSKLSPKLYEIVRTPEFKAWFGDWENDPKNASKVVDENGEPLLVYHGTNQDFSTFDLKTAGKRFNEEHNTTSDSGDYGMWGVGFYFSPIKKFSQHYGSKIMKLFLNIRNPFVRDPNLTGTNSEFQPVRGKEASLKLREEILSKGYDGVIHVEGTPKIPAPIMQIIAFEPNQIKLADGKNTTFDPNNDDIRFKDGGTVLLAPNGNPTKLTPEQYKLVRTPEFKAWFGDWENDPENASKVIDENGEPLVVYHGTTKYFTIFNKKYATKNTKVNHGYLGHFFTPNFDLAIDFTKKDWTNPKSPNKSNWFYAMKCFLNIKNPKSTSVRGFTMMNTTKDTQNMLKEYGYDGVIVNKWEDDEKESWITLFGSKGVKEFDYKQFVAFNSNQIKLADGKNTTFDPNNDDIRFKDGGSIDNEKIVCHKCDWSWKVEDGGDDLYVCHKCGYDNAPYYATKFAGGGSIDINEPFNVNGKTLAERVRILLKQLYPDYKWSVTSSYNKLDVYLLEADFEPFTDLFKEQHPDRKYYNINNWDFSEYNRENKAQVTDRALEVFKPIREYIDKFVYNRNANDPYADYSDYNIYEYTYIGKWDKPYVQVEPKAGKRAKTPSTPKVAPIPISPEPKFKVGDIITYRNTGDKKYKVIEFIEFDKEIQENVYRIESLSDKTKGKAKESMMSLIEQKNLDNTFTIQNIVSKTQWSDGLKQAMIQDFVNSGYENITPLIGSDMRETSKNIEKKVDGFASEKNTYLQANYLADLIHTLIDAGNTPTPSEPTAEIDNFLEYLKSNNEKATFIPRELEMMNALTLFIQSAKDIEGLDADRYANLLANMIGKLTPTK